MVSGGCDRNRALADLEPMATRAHLAARRGDLGALCSHLREALAAAVSSLVGAGHAATSTRRSRKNLTVASGEP